MKQISQKELNERTYESKRTQEEIINVVMPKGTKERIMAYADNFSKYAREVILKDLDRRDKNKDRNK